MVASEPEADAAVAPPPTAFAPLVADAAGKLPGLEVITRTDLRNLMGLETEKQLMGCESDSCLAEISDALGADLVYFISVEQLGESIVVSSTLHTTKAELIGRRVIRADSISAIADQIPTVVDELVGSYLRKQKRPADGGKRKLLINYKDAPKKPASTTTPSPPTTPNNGDYQAAIAAAQQAAEDAKRKAMEQVKEAQRRAMAAARFPQPGYLGDLADLAYCIEVGVPRILQSEERYRSWRDGDGEQAPTCKERYVSYGLYQGYEHAIEPCQNAVKRSPASLKDEAKALADAVASAVPILAEAETYYDDEDYEEDACATGQRLHPKLLSAYAAVRAASRNATRKLDDAAAEQTKAVDGSKHYQALGQVVHHALTLASMAPITGDDDVKPKQLKALQAENQKLRTAIDAAMALKKPSSPDLASSWDSVYSRLKSEKRWFKVTVRELKKKSGQRKLKQKGKMYDPTALRLRSLALAREMGTALPPEARGKGNGGETAWK